MKYILNNRQFFKCVKIILISNKKHGIIRLYLNRIGIGVMSMKIAKKILAGALAVVSAFTAASAEPVKIEKPTDSSISTKEDKKPNCESTLKELAKGAAITAGVTSIAAVGAVIGGAIDLIRNNKDVVLLEASRKVFEWYLDLDTRLYVVRISTYKEHIKLAKVLLYLFYALLNCETIDKQSVEKNLLYVYFHMKIFGYKSGSQELDDVLNEYDKKTGHCTIKCLTPYDTLENYLSSPTFGDKDRYSICIDSIAGFSEFKSEYKEKFMQIRSSTSNSVYELKAIMLSDEKNCYFTTGYRRLLGETWEKCSFYGDKEEFNGGFSDLVISKLVSCGRKVNLVYVKTRKNSL